MDKMKILLKDFVVARKDNINGCLWLHTYTLRSISFYIFYKYIENIFKKDKTYKCKDM